MLVQHFAYWVSKGAVSHIIDMVWLYSAPVPVGNRGGILLVQMNTTCLHAPRGRGRGVSTLWTVVHVRSSTCETNINW
jgi:hypothetical protein